MKPETDNMTKHNLFGTYVDLERAFYFHRPFIYIDHSVKNNALYEKGCICSYKCIKMQRISIRNSVFQNSKQYTRT